jgi:hypothetical protein
MDTLLITSKERINLLEINRRLAQHWQVEGAAKDRLVIQESGSRVYLYLACVGGTTEANKRPCDIESHQLLVDYSDVVLVKKVIVAVADNADFIVDNDFGTVLPGDQFVARINRESEWNWRDS